MRPGKYYPDGYNGGGEMPDDKWLDRMIWPESQDDAPPRVEINFEMTHAEMSAAAQAADEQQECDHLEQDRQFVVTEENLTGAKTGPPRTR